MNNLKKLFVVALFAVAGAILFAACSANAKAPETKEPEVVYLTVPDRTEYLLFCFLSHL